MNIAKWSEAVKKITDEWVSHVRSAETQAEKARRRDDTNQLHAKFTQVWDDIGPGADHLLRARTINGFVTGARMRSKGI